ncbi:trehalose-6-phosphate phosphatase D [Hibiscus trionum]|uniref:Trehalose-6-phosphate phosphatase D n=1 Tax=Hibiscus trionum TaxID=183268 RepID=A0A9W7MHB1_HIBTR|nr:trehalose-6-phosphate phosphatase D [Hibiscus trionum]
MFEQIVAASRWKQIVMFLGYDPDPASIPKEINIFIFSAIKLVLQYFLVHLESDETGRCRDKGNQGVVFQASSD